MNRGTVRDGETLSKCADEALSSLDISDEEDEDEDTILSMLT